MGDVGNNGAYARLRAQATSIRNRNWIRAIQETSSIFGTRRPDLLVRYKLTPPR